MLCLHSLANSKRLYVAGVTWEYVVSIPLLNLNRGKSAKAGVGWECFVSISIQLEEKQIWLCGRCKLGVLCFYYASN